VEELRARFEAAARIELRLLGRDAAATDEQFSSLGAHTSSVLDRRLRRGSSKRALPVSSLPDRVVDSDVAIILPIASAISRSHLPTWQHDLESEPRTTLFVIAEPRIGRARNRNARGVRDHAELCPR